MTLDSFYESARAEGLPVITPEVMGFYRFLLGVKRPEKVLEVGCCVGFTAMLAAGFTGEGGSVTTIDRFDYMIARARENFRAFGLTDKIRLLEGDAGQILPMLRPGFDFIFIDAAKGQYSDFLREGLRLLNPGGIILFDDVIRFPGGDVYADRLSVPRRQRTIHTRLNQFIAEFRAAEEVTGCVLDIGDGVAVGRKEG